MNWIIAVGAAILGYLCGSLSFARIVTRIVAPEIDIGEGVDLAVPGSDEVTHMDQIAGTAVAAKLGDRYGGLTALGDVLKVFVPTIVLYFVFRGLPYYLFAAGFGVVGHNYPLYHRFKGGAGLSPITGGFLVVAPLGVILLSITSTLFGFLLLKGTFGIFLGYSGWILLMIPWIWFTSHDVPELLYAVGVNVVFTIAMIPTIQDMIEQQRSGEPMPEFDEMLQAIPHGRHLLKLRARLQGGSPKQGTEP
jgi:glycerol-3-phosphate acyltransferase PlsY